MIYRAVQYGRKDVSMKAIMMAADTVALLIISIISVKARREGQV